MRPAADLSRVLESMPEPDTMVPASTAIRANTTRTSTRVNARARAFTRRRSTTAWSPSITSPLRPSLAGRRQTLGNADVVRRALLLVGAVRRDDDVVVGAGQHVLLSPGVGRIGGRVELLFLDELADRRTGRFVVHALPVLDGAANDARPGLRALDLRFLESGQREHGDAARDHRDDGDDDQNFY